MEVGDVPAALCCAVQPPKGPPELEAVEALLAEYDSLIIATEEAEGR